MPSYTVQQGDHLSGIAQKFGFLDFNTIWKHPNNAELRSKRQEAHVLNPGDVLYIPDKEKKTVAVPTTKTHDFKVSRKRLMLRIVLKDFDEQPVADTECELEVEGNVFHLKSGKDGLIEAAIPVTAVKGSLKVPELGLELPLKIGFLDPPEEDSGWQARLINLGYHAGPVGDTDEEQLGYAIEEFQCDHKLPVTGELDAATRTKLKEAHGS